MGAALAARVGSKADVADTSKAPVSVPPCALRGRRNRFDLARPTGEGTYTVPCANPKTLNKP